MHIIVVGADPVGEQLIQLAIDGGHNIVLIEPNQERAEHCAQAYDAQVLHAGIDEEGILDEAGADHAHALIATTADDSINIMTMVMGQEYAIKTLISTVNSKHRKPLFDRLGVSTLVDPEILAARHLLNLASNTGGKNVTAVAGQGQIYELTLDVDSALAKRSVGDINNGGLLPKETAIVLIERDGKRLFPKPDTQLRAEDFLLVFSVHALTRNDLKLFDGDGE